MFRKTKEIAQKLSAVIISAMIAVSSLVSGGTYVHAAVNGSQTEMTLTKGPDFQYPDWFDVDGAWNTCAFYLDGNIAYCGQSSRKNPNLGSYPVQEISDSKVIKMVYYGYGGPGYEYAKAHGIDFTDGFAPYGSDTEKNAILGTHMLVSWAYSKDLYGIDKNDAEKEYNTIMKMYDTMLSFPDVPNRYRCYAAVPDDSSKQTVLGIGYIPEGKIKLTKKSDSPLITEQNKYYSLNNAVYGVYSDKECTSMIAEIKTDENGQGISEELKTGSYWIKEVKSPEGYRLDTEIYPVQVSSNSDVPAVVEVNVSDSPFSASANLTVTKTDEDGSDSSRNLSLEGAEFTVCYYDGYYSMDSLPSSPARTWKIKTKKSDSGSCIAKLEKEYLADGDKLFTSDGKTVLPLGTVTIEETKAPEGYTLENSYFKADGKEIKGKYLTHIEADGQTASISGSHSLVVPNLPVRGDFSFTKRNADTKETMANVSFTVVSDTTGEKHEIRTDKNGFYSSAEDSSLWFGSETSKAGNRGSLPYGSYTVKENECSENKGMKLTEFKFSISQNSKTVEIGDILNSPVSLKTEAVEKATGSHYAGLSSQTVIADTVSYCYLDTDKEYRMEGILMDRETGQSVKDENGNEIKAEKTFRPSSENGTVIMEFSFNSSFLQGHDVVVYEKCLHDNREVISHADISDKNQTVHFPSLKTEAKDTETQTSMSYASEHTELTDTVYYANLDTERTYIIEGILVDRETGSPVKDAEGNEITAFSSFKPENSEGEEKVIFKFDSSLLKGKTTVVFETLKSDNTIYAVHSDLKDRGQTIYFPEIHTSVRNGNTDIQTVKAAENAIVTDRVEYSNLIPGKEYTIKGILMNRDTGKPAVSHGKTIESSATLTPASPCGTAIMEFKFDATELKGETSVVFEEIRISNHPVASHADLDDVEQTVYFPEIHTTAYGKGNTHNITPDRTSVITDRVEYHNLVPGKQYRIEGILMDRKKGKAVENEGKEIKSEKVFVPDRADGYVDVEFHFDSSLLKGKTVVVFEYISESGTEVAAHTDINDESQSINIENPSNPVTCEFSKKGIRTGDDGNAAYFLSFGTAAAALSVLMWQISRKQKKEKDNME